MSSQRPGKLEKISAKQHNTLLKRTFVIPPSQSGTVSFASQPSESITTPSHYFPRTTDG